MKKKIKKPIKGDAKRPRLVVFRSNNHIYAQVIDDSIAQTLLSCSTVETDIKNQLNNATSTVEAALLVGKTIGERLKEKNIDSVIFDRNKKIYHGRVKGIADGARSVGLII